MNSACSSVKRIHFYVAKSIFNPFECKFNWPIFELKLGGLDRAEVIMFI